MSKKILITVGGTGGHIFPAVALGKQLIQHSPGTSLLYVGGNLGSNPYFERSLFSHKSVSCATFKRKNPFSLLQTFGKIAWGVSQSYKILKDFDPDLVVGFGSYYTLPVLIASKLQAIPFILHEANSVPGKVNRLLSKYAAVTGIHFPETAEMLKGKTCEVGLPLRPGYRLNTCSKAQARLYFGLDPNRQTLLVFGGSQGAVNLNRLISKAITQHQAFKTEEWQVIHIVGDMNFEQIIADEYFKIGLKACVKTFEPCMDLAWQAADMSVARAGAGTIAEQLEFEIPGILIPYPHATDNHQEKNANFLSKQVKGSVTCLESQLTPQDLSKILQSLSKEKRNTMSESMKAYKKQHRPKEFYNLIQEALNI